MLLRQKQLLLERKRKIRMSRKRITEEPRLPSLDTSKRDMPSSGVLIILEDWLLVLAMLICGFMPPLTRTALRLSKRPKWDCRVIKTVLRISSGVLPRSMSLPRVQLTRQLSCGI